MKPTVIPFGDRALLIEVGTTAAAHHLAALLVRAVASGRTPEGIGDVVVGLHSVVVHGDRHTEWPALDQWLQALSVDHQQGTPPDHSPARPVLDIPVVFDGPDLDLVAHAIGGTPHDVIDLLTGVELSVAFLGFAPGFPYLVGLPPELEATARRPTPRPSVPAGSVALAGGFASVYPSTTPGGWMLLGRTTTRMFDPSRPPYALLRPSDRVRFTIAPTPSLPRAEAPGPGRPGPGRPVPRRPLVARGARFVEVKDPGILSLVEDGGRHGVAGLGVPRAGPCDPDAMGLANLLVGNVRDTAAIEVTVRGPSLRFASPAHVAVVGSTADAVDVHIDGRPCPNGTVLPVGAGQTVTVGRLRTGLRAYLAVSGGIVSTGLLDSASSDLLSGLGPGPLVESDRLGLGTPTRPRGLLDLRSGQAHPGGPQTVRVIAGPHPFPPATWRHLVSDRWTVGADSNRIGIRLASHHSHLDTSGVSVVSTGMVIGAIQVPPDGDPIMLMPDHATVGGYPVIACVSSVDLTVIGQLAPGDEITFTPIDIEAARRAQAQRERELDTRVTGWFPTQTGT